MDEKLIKEISERVTEQSYVPSDWVGVSDTRVVRLNDVIDILESYKPVKHYGW